MIVNDDPSLTIINDLLKRKYIFSGIPSSENICLDKRKQFKTTFITLSFSKAIVLKKTFDSSKPVVCLKKRLTILVHIYMNLRITRALFSIKRNIR